MTITPAVCHVHRDLLLATLAAFHLRRNAVAPVVHSRFSWAMFSIKVD